MLRLLPASIGNPNLLVGFETSDDAGVFRLSEHQALVQTVDFFTPIVDDPYAYGAIAAANSLSDVYAMGGKPLTALNIACFDPDSAPAEMWTQILKGMADKTVESGAAIIGGHSVVDSEPKFGMAVTGLVDPANMFVNTLAKPGDHIYLSKPLGVGVAATAAKHDRCPPELLEAAIAAMCELNAAAAEVGLAAGARCATDITGFGLAGHLFNIARASRVRIKIEWQRLPMLSGIEDLIRDRQTTAGGARNRDFLAEALVVGKAPDWVAHLAVDPQTSGGLAILTEEKLDRYPMVGVVVSGEPGVELV